MLQGVGGQEIYSFIGGFSGYHQIIIAKEYRHKTTFITKWGCSQYTIMLFSIKIVPAIFSWLVVVAFKEFIHKFLAVYMDEWTVYGLVKYHTTKL